MNQDSKDILELFLSTGALMEGHFRLSSGQHSNRYLQCSRIFQYPELARKIGAKLADQMSHLPATAVIAPAIGGILVAHEVAFHLNTRAIFGERQNGKMILKRGFEISSGEKLLIVEDIITTGKSTKEILELVDDHKGNVIGIGCIADRSTDEINFPVSLYSLLKIEITNWDTSNCPLCKDKIPLDTPGSRFQK